MPQASTDRVPHSSSSSSSGRHVASINNRGDEGGDRGGGGSPFFEQDIILPSREPRRFSPPPPWGRRLERVHEAERHSWGWLERCLGGKTYHEHSGERVVGMLLSFGLNEYLVFTVGERGNLLFGRSSDLLRKMFVCASSYRIIITALPLLRQSREREGGNPSARAWVWVGVLFVVVKRGKCTSLSTNPA